MCLCCNANLCKQKVLKLHTLILILYKVCTLVCGDALLGLQASALWLCKYLINVALLAAKHNVYRLCHFICINFGEYSPDWSALYYALSIVIGILV